MIDFNIIKTGLDNKQINLLKEIADALRAPIDGCVNPHSDICSEAFVDDFVNRLKLYHALNEDALKKKTFEYAFEKSSKAAGRNASVNENSVNAGGDVIVNGVSFSLKTEAAKNISGKYIVISKLMEARWVRDCNSAADYADGIICHVVRHIQKYERVIMLRALKKDQDHYEYRLIEIPYELLCSIYNIKKENISISQKGKKSIASIPIHYKGKIAFTLKLDLSVEKITIRKLPEKMCKRHGAWIIPIRRVVALADAS